MNVTVSNESLEFSLVNISLSHSFLRAWFGLTVSLSIISSFLCILLIASIVLTQHKWRKGATVLIVHLLCLDLFACAVTFPAVTIDVFLMFNGRVLHSLCPLDAFLPIAVWYTNCWATALLALNRFVAILFPSFYRYLTTRRALMLTMLTSWLIGSSAYAPALFGVGARFVVRPPYNLCTVVPFHDHAWYAMVSVGLGVPVILEGTAYLVLFIVLTSRPAGVDSQAAGGERAKKRLRRKINVARMLCLSYLSCLVCYAVVPLLTGMFGVNAAGESMEIGLLAVTLELFGYMIAPMVYLALNEEYRRGARRILCGRLRGMRVADAELFTITNENTAKTRVDPDTL
ncbi:rhodopsin-like [Paramacrobiotus metropolitanus]|uniref:rhodopsin-like n=1 Tax=Paramacrobiotus metropolitanus TaxID=2943436 RepID=UPI0024457367|nr:rhodopsin-like [Paramacrobiotus metropolitanus]